MLNYNRFIFNIERIVSYGGFNFIAKHINPNLKGQFKR